MRSGGGSHTVLGNSRYIGNGGNNRLIYNSYNYENIIPSLTSNRPTIRLNYSASEKARSFVDESHNHQVGNDWIGKSYLQGRSSIKSDKNRRYFPGGSHHFRKNIIGEVSSRVIPIPISNHASEDNFSIKARNQGERKIKESENKSVFEGRRISSRTQNYVKIIPNNHIPIKLNSKDRIKHSNKVVKNNTKTEKGKINIVKLSTISQNKTSNLSNKIDAKDNLQPNKVKPLNLITIDHFKDSSKNVVTPRPNSKVAFNSHLKNWPSDSLQSVEDLYNYEKYTTFPEAATKKPSVHKIHKIPEDSGNKRITSNQVTSMHPSMQEMIQWLKIPAFATNQSHLVAQESEKPISNTFEPIYEDLEPNTPLKPIEEEQIVDKIDNGEFIKPQYYFSSPQFDTIINHLQDPVLKRRPVYRPISDISQNTVVHISNTGSKTPEVTHTESNYSPSKPIIANQKPSSPPNVHIMFMDDEMMNSSNVGETSAPGVKDDCPTIMINSITKVKNKIQSKEGCTDLNIVINSHILNTNVFTSPATSSTGEDQYATEGQKNPDGNVATDKYDGQFTNDLQYTNQFTSQYTNGPVYTDGPQYTNKPTASSDIYDKNYYTPNQNNPYQPVKDTENPAVEGNQEVENNPAVDDNLDTFEIFQGTNIQIGPSSSNEVEFANEVQGAENAADTPETGGGSSAGSTSDAENAPAVETASGVAPAAEASQALQSSSALEPGPGQANDAAGSEAILSIPRPNFPNLSGVTNQLPSLAENFGGGQSGASGGPLSDSTALTTADADDDGEYGLDISPSSIMESMTSLFSYFEYLNPLHYGMFSIAMAPFTAFAAGVLGVAAFLFPWALPGALDFARSSDKVTIRFTPSLEEVVKQSIHKYRNWNEWKSKRRKTRRKR